MTRRYFRFDGKEVKEIGVSAPAESMAAFVHGDTFERPLKHPVTGEFCDSMTRWNAINRRHGLEIIGNDLLSKEKHLRPQVDLSEAQILDRIDRAESIAADPTKYRAWQNMNQERFHRVQRLIHGSR